MKNTIQTAVVLLCKENLQHFFFYSLAHHCKVQEFLKCSFQAAEAQEALEEESLNKVENEVRRELEQTLQGNDVSFFYHLSFYVSHCFNF